MLVENFTVSSPNVVDDGETLTSTYQYSNTSVERAADGKWTVQPTTTEYQFKTEKKVPKLG